MWASTVGNGEGISADGYIIDSILLLVLFESEGDLSECLGV